MSENREDIITEALKSIFYAGVGAVAVTAEKSKEIIDSLVEKGQISVDQGKLLNKELKHTIDKNRKKQAPDEKEASFDPYEKVEGNDFSEFLSGLTDEQKQALKDQLN